MHSSSEGRGRIVARRRSAAIQAAERAKRMRYPDSPSSSGAELSRQASELSVSSVVYSELPGYDGTLSEVLMKVRSIVEEYYMNEDPAEALLPLREVAHPQWICHCASKGCIELVFEKFPNDMTSFVICSYPCGPKAQKRPLVRTAKAFINSWKTTTTCLDYRRPASMEQKSWHTL